MGSSVLSIIVRYSRSNSWKHDELGNHNTEREEGAHPHTRLNHERMFCAGRNCTEDTRSNNAPTAHHTVASCHLETGWKWKKKLVKSRCFRTLILHTISLHDMWLQWAPLGGNSCVTRETWKGQRRSFASEGVMTPEGIRIITLYYLIVSGAKTKTWMFTEKRKTAWLWRLQNYEKCKFVSSSWGKVVLGAVTWVAQLLFICCQLFRALLPSSKHVHIKKTQHRRF